MMRAVALASGLALAACGRLSTPDLGTGALTGRLLNATAAAYVYPLGRPDLAVRPAADGRYTLEKVPVETTALVVVDGSAPSWVAALVPVSVDGAAARVVPEVDAAALPVAGGVGAVARLGGGCVSVAIRFTVVGTDQVNVAAAPGSAAMLQPLPAGTFQLEATAAGFTPRRLEITVFAGATTPYDVPLDVELGEAAPGCAAPGAGCRTGLTCNPADGTCDPPATTGAMCDACAAPEDCASGVCSADGSCGRSCAVDADCPAGFACQPEGGGGACQAPQGCNEAREAFGADCFFDADCADHLGGAVCSGANTASTPPIPGYCTGRCSVPEDCTLVPGYACVSGVCTRTL
jgi:hypothetical protein